MNPWFLFKEDNLLGAHKQKLPISFWPPTLSRTGNALGEGTIFGMHRAQEECSSKPQLARPQLKFLVQERSQWTELGLKRNIQPSRPHHGCQAMTQLPSLYSTGADVGLSCSLSIIPQSFLRSECYLSLVHLSWKSIHQKKGLLLLFFL